MSGVPLRLLPRFAALLLLLLACGRTTLPARASRDSSRSLAGDWTIEFRLDSVRGPQGSVVPWQPASSQTAQGTLHLSDSTAGRPAGAVRSRIDVDFNPLLGRPMSCFDPRPTSTSVSQDSETTSLRFTPNAADCGFAASGKFYGDSLVGTWDESSFTGPKAKGRFRMIRGAR